nr:glycoside hydrolase TIM-barrel-like domain-containing protein [Hyphomonadaceae bacterium]
GARDDQAQRLALEASLNAWRAGPQINPLSPVYGGPMVDPDRIHLWCWDARPAPWFPGLPHVWADSAHALKGHWLSGRVGLVPLARIVADVCAAAGTDCSVAAVSGLLEGYVLQGPMRARDLLQPLAAAFGLQASTQGGQLVWQSAGPPQADHILLPESLVQEAGQPLITATITRADIPASLTLSALCSGAGGLEPNSITVGEGAVGPAISLDLPAVLDRSLARDVACNLLSQAQSTGETLTVTLAPADALQLEPGDRLALAGFGPKVWEVTRIDGLYPAQAMLSPAASVGSVPRSAGETSVPALAQAPAKPHLVVLDLPPGLHPGSPPELAVGLFGQPWAGPCKVRVGDRPEADIVRAVTMGALQNALAASPVGLTLAEGINVSLWGGSLPVSGRGALLEADTVVDIIGWSHTTLVGQGLWRLERVHRGLSGAPMGPALPAGATFVLLDQALVPLALPAGTDGIALDWTVTDARGVTCAQYHTAHAPIQHRPWSPVRVTAKREEAGVVLGWVRRGNQADAGWGGAEVPAVAAILETNGPGVLYPSARELSDFGAAQATLDLEIAPIAADGLPGGVWRGTVPVVA